VYATRLQEKRAKEKEAAAEGGEDEGVDPDMMALMGFGGFGGSKK
jgi:hypothetical protein